MNYNYLTTIYRSIATQIYVFLVLFTTFILTLKSKKQGKDQDSIQSSPTPDTVYQWESDNFTTRKAHKQNCKYVFTYQKFVHLGKNTSIYCSRIIVFTFTISVDPDEIQHHAALHLGLHSLQKYSFRNFPNTKGKLSLDHV